MPISLLLPRLLPILLLVGCGALPQPFFGNPGADGARLAEPPTSRLAVPMPTQALLPDDAATSWAQATADALQAADVPALAEPSARGKDWTLALTAVLRGPEVVPSYEVRNPKGEPQGSLEGQPVPARAWAQGDSAMLKAAAVQAAPGISTLLNRIEAARRQSDPNSLLNRPARIWVAGVSGAPGDGDRSLSAQMRMKLADVGLVVQDSAKDADFKLEGDVQTAKGAGNTTRVELQWVVSDAKGERGRIVQINEVPPRTIEPYWGDVAVAVAKEAAGGVRDVVANATRTREPDQAAQKPPS